MFEPIVQFLSDVMLQNDPKSTIFVQIVLLSYNISSFTILKTDPNFKLALFIPQDFKYYYILLFQLIFRIFGNALPLL
jgi:hypothetical protein